MDTLRYALVGAGMMGQEHLRNLALVREIHQLELTVAAIVEPDDCMRAAALALARSLGNLHVQAYRQLDELPTAGIDAFLIVSPNFTHHAIMTDLLPLGKAIMVETPVCTTLEQCDDLLHRLDGHGAPVWVAMEYRYMPPTARFLSRLVHGDIGTLHMLSMREHRFPFRKKVNDWNRFSENTGDTLVGKCCHHFDLMRLMSGSEAVRIFASGGRDVNHLHESCAGRTPDILDNALVVVDFASGVRAALELCMFADGADPQEQLSAIGTVGKLDAFIPGPERFWPDAAERHAQVILSPRDQSGPQCETLRVDPALAAAGDHHGATYYQHVRFAKSILLGDDVEVSAHDGVMAVRMGLAAQESIRTGQAVAL